MMKDEILQTFGKITLRDRNHAVTANSRSDGKSSDVKRSNDKYVKDNASAKEERKNANGERECNVTKRYKCGLKDPVSLIRPKNQG